MITLSEHVVFIFVAQLGLIILMAHLFGSVMHRFRQPVIVGEVLAGIVMGPAVFGKIWPSAYAKIFPPNEVQHIILQAVSWLCVIFLLLITGLEIDLKSSLRHAHQNILTSLGSLLIPFLGVTLIVSVYPSLIKTAPLAHRLLISLCLSVTAIPVIAKILFDLKILRSYVGLNIITSGVLSDMWGWSLLAVILALAHSPQGTHGAGWTAVVKPLISMGAYLWLTVAAGRLIVNKLFDWLRVRFDEPNTVLALIFALALINGAISHLLGLHVILGAFIAGLMAGESERISAYVRQSIQDFIFGVFAPIFFVLIGMQLKWDSIQSWGLLFLLLVGTSIFKIAGGYLGARLGGLGRRNAFAIACGLNTQGTMGIIIALIGLEIGVLSEELFAVIVFICIATSLMVGPSLNWAMKRVRRTLADYIQPDHIFMDVPPGPKEEVIRTMARLMKERGFIKDEELVASALWEREREMSTAVGDGIALPHARLKGLGRPVMCVFKLAEPVDYESPDNKPVQLLFLELTDQDDEGMQLNLIAQVARFLSDEENKCRVFESRTPEELYQIIAVDENA